MLECLEENNIFVSVFQNSGRFILFSSLNHTSSKRCLFKLLIKSQHTFQVEVNSKKFSILTWNCIFNTTNLRIYQIHTFACHSIVFDDQIWLFKCKFDGLRWFLTTFNRSLMFFNITIASERPLRVAKLF